MHHALWQHQLAPAPNAQCAAQASAAYDEPVIHVIIPVGVCMLRQKHVRLMHECWEVEQQMALFETVVRPSQGADTQKARLGFVSCALDVAWYIQGAAGEHPQGRAQVPYLVQRIRGVRDELPDGYMRSQHFSCQTHCTSQHFKLRNHSSLLKLVYAGAQWPSKAKSQ